MCLAQHCIPHFHMFLPFIYSHIGYFVVLENCMEELPAAANLSSEALDAPKKNSH